MKASIPRMKVDWLIHFYLRQGITLAELKSSGIFVEGSNIESVIFLPIVDYFKLLNWGSARLENETLGLLLGQIIQPGDFGPLSHAAYHFNTLREVLVSIERYHALVSQGIAFEIQEADTEVRMVFNVILPTDECVRQDIELTLSLLAGAAGYDSGGDWFPLRVTFAHAAPIDDSSHRLIFGNDVLFNASHNAIVYRKEDLDREITTGDSDTAKRYTSQLETLMDDVLREETILANTRYYVRSTLGTEHCNAESIAKLMCMSRRTLTRHLTHMATGFRQIRDDVVIESAKQMLRKKRYTVAVAALELGFSDSTAFSRAFKKITGQSPSSYRQTALAEF